MDSYLRLSKLSTFDQFLEFLENKDILATFQENLLLKFHNYKTLKTSSKAHLTPNSPFKRSFCCENVQFISTWIL